MNAASAIAAPPGWTYSPDFLTAQEQNRLFQHIQTLPLAPLRMKGVLSKRLVLHYGWDYHYDAWKIKPTDPMPEFIVALRVKAAQFFDQDPIRFEEALINGYPTGAGIGWHRDAPMFGSPVIGISLGAPCLMRFRKKQSVGYETYKQVIAPGSIYAMDGESRTVWQHTIPGVKGVRYSITFRTLSPRF
jgi:alkylated DNA repair dioxygenase AlkB